MRKIALTILLLLSLFELAKAADTSPAIQDATWLKEARASIKSDQYDQAIEHTGCK
jgi:sensor domain CHASE-containing protein